MTNSDSFVSRWARKKREAASEQRNAPEAEEIQASSNPSPDPELTLNQHSETVNGPGDPLCLPPIESIVANTDIRAFLQSRVPAELTRAALRQAWASDPAIRDFIGIAENQWDFNDPATIPGFGALAETDNVPALLRQALGEFDRAAAPLSEAPGVVERAQPAAIADVSTGLDQPDILSEPDESDGEGAAAADHVVEEVDGLPERRTHGGALPR